MGKVLAAVAAVLIALFLILIMLFRGPVVQVLPAEVGRIKTSAGFEEGLKHPSIFRLPANWFGMNPTKLVVVEVSDNFIQEDIPTLFMPKDRLNLDFQVVGTFAVRSDKEWEDAIYDRVTPEPTQSSSKDGISFEDVYAVYGQQIVRTIAQEVVSENTIQYVLEHLEIVSAEIKKRVDERLATTPLLCKNLGLGNIQPPRIIIDAQESAKERQIQQTTAQAEMEVQLIRADARLQVGLLEQQLDLVEAETQVLADLILSDAVSAGYIAQRSLRALQTLAENPNAIFVLTTRVFEDPKSLLGLNGGEVDRLKIDAETQRRLDEVLAEIERTKEAELEKMRKEAEQIRKEQGNRGTQSGDPAPVDEGG